MVTGVGFQHPWEEFAFENSRLSPFNFQRGYRSLVSSECLERTRCRNNCSGIKMPQLALTADLCHALWCLVFGGFRDATAAWRVSHTALLGRGRSHSLGRSRRVSYPLLLAAALLLTQLCNSLWES